MSREDSCGVARPHASRQSRPTFRRLPSALALRGCSAAAVLASGGIAHGGFTDYDDRSLWEAAVGRFTTIGFCEFAPGTFITEQYADLGVHFTDGNDTIKPFDPITYPNDGCGFDGNGDITIVFDTPQLWIGTDFPGFLSIHLFSGMELIHTGNFGGEEIGNFGGVIATQPFNRAVLTEGALQAEIDDLHFGVPSPGGLAVLALGVCCHRRRRLTVGVGATARGADERRLRRHRSAALGCASHA